MRAFSLLLLACLVGLALPARAQQRGDVIVTEVLANPNGTTTDAAQEWFELFNNSNRPRDLQNWIVRDSAASGIRPRHLISASLVMPPYGFVVLGNGTNTATNGGQTVNYAYGPALQLANSLDRVTVERPDPTLIGVAVAHAYYSMPAISAFEGTSRERSSIEFDTALPYNRENMDGSNWLSGTEVYGVGGRGTPGRAGQTNTFGLGPADAVATSAAAGYRLLSAPVGLLDVGDLADFNLVQGLSDEFPTFGANLFTHYSGNPGTGAGGFVAPLAKTDTLRAGRGLLWYMYTEGGPTPDDPRGTSRRADLPLTIWLGGRVRTTDVTTTFTAAERTGATNEFYMLGNPFTDPFDLSGLTATSGTLSDVIQLYDPVAGYVVRTRVPGIADSDSTDDVAVWQGFLAEFSAAPTFPFDFAYEADARTPTNPPLVGRTVGAAAYARVGLALDGVTAAGTTHDEAAVLYFSPLATTGWDTYDASKAPPIANPAGSIAPVGPGPDGAPRWHAQRSLPLDLAAPVTVPVAFSATHAGTYTFSLRTFQDVPAGWQVTLTDNTTGAATVLASGATYTFTADAGTAAERFAVTVVPGAVTATEGTALASAYALAPVTPNPSAAGARAEVRVRDAQAVRAEVFDVLGRRVAVVFDGTLAAGASQALEIRSDGLRAGAYVLRVTGAGFAAAQTFHVAR